MNATAAQEANDACTTLVSCAGTTRSRDGCAEQHIADLGRCAVLEEQGRDGERIATASIGDIELNGCK